MNLSRILHQEAMDHYDLALISKAKGNLKGWEEHIQKAYFLSKEAALKIQAEPEDSIWKYLYARSAGWVAFKFEKYDEAVFWAELGLSGNPPEQEKKQFLEILEGVKKKGFFGTKEKNNGNSISGIIIQADVEHHNIKLLEFLKKKRHLISVPDDLFQNVSRSYIGEPVEIEFVKNEDGTSVLKHIKRAA